MEEIIDIVDESNNLTWVTEKKSIAHKKWLWHRAVHIWIYNNKWELLIQKRAKIKNYLPWLWDLSVGGHISAWEEPIVSAIREVWEEIGIDIWENDLDFQFVKKEQNHSNWLKNNEFLYVYTMSWNGDISKLKLQKEEVEQVKFIDLNEFKKQLTSNTSEFVPHQDYWFEMIEILENKVTKWRLG